ncbi:MAG: hypothetical protein NC094_10080 [Bacteroidales bacterium]|nr:hypothetical protein [Lachnoclostridium sp.]MCM1383267.1 hypothetical protein [Lachnoclostridium sp.]MCM1465755.1 hypothetical protein [Bacteroidales bacterium]
MNQQEKKTQEGKSVQSTSTPYDDVFRTLLNDCSPLIIPVINEVFGEKYTGKEKILFSPNEHFLNRQGGSQYERITDTSFRIVGTETKKYHLECQSGTDSSMLVRFFEYDTQIALEDRGIKENVLTVKFPYSAVFFLRSTASTPDKLKIRMVMPDMTSEYDIPVMKLQEYMLTEIFEKNLLFLLPFYIFVHEKRFREYEHDKAKLRELQEEYKQISSKLEELLHNGSITEYTKCTIMDMSNKVLEHITAKYGIVREGVKEVMVGRVLEYEAKTILRRGIEQGIEQGISQGIEQEKTEIILDFLGELGEIPAELENRIKNQKNPKILRLWCKSAARAQSLQEFEERIEGL